MKKTSQVLHFFLCSNQKAVQWGKLSQQTDTIQDNDII